MRRWICVSLPAMLSRSMDSSSVFSIDLHSSSLSYTHTPHYYATRDTPTHPPLNSTHPAPQRPNSLRFSRLFLTFSFLFSSLLSHHHVIFFMFLALKPVYTQHEVQKSLRNKKHYCVKNIADRRALLWWIILFSFAFLTFNTLQESKLQINGYVCNLKSCLGRLRVSWPIKKSHVT